MRDMAFLPCLFSSAAPLIHVSRDGRVILYFWEADGMTSSVVSDRDRLLIGLRLRDIRLQTGATLGELALQLGVSAPYLSNIERGRRLPSPELLILLARNLDVNLNYLLVGRAETGRAGLSFRSDEELLTEAGFPPRPGRWSRL